MLNFKNWNMFQINSLKESCNGSVLEMIAKQYLEDKKSLDQFKEAFGMSPITRIKFEAALNKIISMVLNFHIEILRKFYTVLILKQFYHNNNTRDDILQVNLI